jgi:hypothetical protein
LFNIFCVIIVCVSFLRQHCLRQLFASTFLRQHFFLHPADDLLPLEAGGPVEAANFADGGKSGLVVR